MATDISRPDLYKKKCFQQDDDDNNNTKDANNSLPM